LYDINMVMKPDEVVAVLGHNGAGKSTLLRSIAGIHKQATGAITFDGVSLLGQSADAIARLGVGFVREAAPVFPHLTVHEHLQLGQALAQKRGSGPRDEAEIGEWFPILMERRQVKAGFLSGGQRQMLALAVALISSPRLLLLDEPSAGLAPSVAATVFEAIHRLSGTGLNVVIAEQNLDWIAEFAERVYFLENGMVTVTGNVRDALVPQDD
jgi:branched-chain amino acid transport system ATP-binding protein